MSSGATTRGAERLYYDSPVLEFAAKVTDIRLVATERNEAGERSQLWQIALDRTAFYPESGGQPWDSGALTATARSGATLAVPVERVEEDDAGEVWHTVRKPLVAGTEVLGQVDAARRLDHTQQHSGQHLLSAMFLELLGACTVSFHLGAESSTIDLALPEGMGALTPGQIEGVEGEANRLVFENRTVTPRWHTREQAEIMLAEGRLRKLPDRSGAMRVVEMAGVEFNACGGTHVGATGAIGSLQLRRIEKVKAGWRVEFVCGLRAVRTARRDFTLLSGLASSLSVSVAGVPERVAALGEEAKAVAKRGKALLEELSEARADALLAATAGAGIVQAVFPDKPVEFAKRVASRVAATGRPAVIGVTEGLSGALAAAVPGGSRLHAGNALREVLATQGARGGGSAELAQGTCRGDQVKALVEALVEALAAHLAGS